MQNDVPMIFKPNEKQLVLYPGSPQLRTTISLSHQFADGMVKLLLEARGIIPDKDRP